MKYLLFVKAHAQTILLAALVAIALYSTFLLLNLGSHLNTDNSLVLLAKQFSIGHLSLEPTTDMPVGDMSLFNGRFYLFYGPFPSIILMPFAVLFGKHFPQVSLGIVSMIITFFATYSISKAFKLSALLKAILSATYENENNKNNP